MSRVQRYLTWLASQDTQSRAGGRSLLGWTIISVLVGVVVWVASEPMSDFFGLRPRPAVLAYLPVLALSVFSALYERTRDPRSIAIAAMEQAGSVLLQLFTWSLVVYSSPSGATVFGAFVIFTAAVHGHAFQGGWTQPYPALGTAVVSGGALLLARDTEVFPVAVVVAPSAVVGSLVLGHFSLTSALARRESDRMRAALQAQAKLEQIQEVERLSETAYALLGRQHDIGTAMTAASFNADTLAELVKEPTDAVEAVADLRDDLVRVSALLDDSKQLGRSSLLPEPATVPLRDCLLAVAGITARLFPGVRVSVDDVPDVSVEVAGGESALERILGNLVQNACEGDGAQTPSRVEITIQVDPRGGQVRMRVKDDGPGFAHETLERPITAFSTTKQAGTGLGLYTVERLLRVSGGSIERKNRPAGGAEVAIHLRLAGE